MQIILLTKMLHLLKLISVYDREGQFTIHPHQTPFSMFCVVPLFTITVTLEQEGAIPKLLLKEFINPPYCL